MIVVMNDRAADKDIEKVKDRIHELGYETHLSRGKQKTIIGIIGQLDREELIDSLGAYPEIEKLVPIQEPYKLASKTFKKDRTRIEIDDLVIGGEKIVIMAGPCAVESEEQLQQAAEAAADSGATVLRGGAFKPRTSPYSFQGLHEKGLKIMARAAENTGLKVVTEVMDPRDVELVSSYAHILQVGARNMQNYFLLREIGKTRKPVLLKRGMSATYRELLMAAEYIMSEGNHQVILCERGIRTFENHTRNTLDLVSIPVLNRLSHLPVVIDPSHGTGTWELVAPAARGAVAMGADGLIIEIHPEPARALSDGQQSLKFDKFKELVPQLKEIASTIGRDI